MNHKLLIVLVVVIVAAAGGIGAYMMLNPGSDELKDDVEAGDYFEVRTTMDIDGKTVESTSRHTVVSVDGDIVTVKTVTDGMELPIPLVMTKSEFLANISGEYPDITEYEDAEYEKLYNSSTPFGNRTTVTYKIFIGDDDYKYITMSDKTGIIYETGSHIDRTTTVNTLVGTNMFR